MHIQVCINEAGALRNQRYAFTDRFRLITELLQNGRRAGATRIDVAHDPDSEVPGAIDDGHGIEDFQKFLTFNESGWDTSTVDEELHCKRFELTAGSGGAPGHSVLLLDDMSAGVNHAKC